MIDFYKATLPMLDDYVTHQGTIHWDRAEKFIWILGEHENEVFRNRIDENKSRRRDKERIVSVTQETNPLLLSEQNAGRSNNLQTFNLFKERIFQKKVDKVARLKAKGDGAKYKKFLTSKKFKEDFDSKKKEINEADKEAFTTKFQNLYLEQMKNKAGDAEESKESAIGEKKMVDVI